MSEGVEIEEIEELIRGIERAIEEGRSRGDSEGMKAEEEGERLLWVKRIRREGEK